MFVSRSSRSFSHSFHHSVSNSSQPGPLGLLRSLVPRVTASRHFVPLGPSRNRRSPIQASYPNLSPLSSFRFTPPRLSPPSGSLLTLLAFGCFTINHCLSFQKPPAVALSTVSTGVLVFHTYLLLLLPWVWKPRPRKPANHRPEGNQ